MKWLTLTKIKQQLRIEQDFTLEDELLTTYGESAEETVLNVCGRTYEDFISSYGAIPSDIVHATLMLVDLSYQHRTPASMQQMYAVPYSFDAKVKPYVRLATPADAVPDQEYIIGSDIKIAVDADLPDELTMEDVNFTVTVINNSKKDTSATYQKADCILTTDGSYVVLVDSETLGIGRYLAKATFFIPDTDYPGGTRKEVVRINPHVVVKG